jgi:glycosyltransferase involved in cell wall biosynthesis
MLIRPQQRRIRVLQVIHSMHIGGAEHAVAHLVRGIDKERFDIAVSCTRELGVLADGLVAESYKVSLDTPKLRSLRYFIPAYLYRAIRRLKADVVHTHNTSGLLHAGPLAALRLMPPWIHTFHYGNYPLPNERQMKAERMFCQRPTQLVAVSESQRGAILRHHGVKPDQIVTVFNGVGRNPFRTDAAHRRAKRAEFGFTDQDVVVGCVAVLSEQKGITYLLQAAVELQRKWDRIKFLVAGGGPLEQALRKQAASLGLGPRIVLTGWRKDNLEILPALDIFVMSSLWEAMPLALLEAMAAGRPIVVTDVGDNRAITENGRGALVIPPRDAPAITSAVSQLMSDPATARALGERAFEIADTRFTTDQMVAEYQRLYVKAYQRNNGR